MPVKNSASSGSKELTGGQLALLCKALESAISEEETLQQIMLFSLEVKLSDIPQAKTHRGLIFNVVNWAGSKSKIRQLVIAASLENSGNVLLQQFVKDHLHVLLELDPVPLPSVDLLITLLTPINDFAGVVLSACTQTLPDIDTDLREQLYSNELSANTKWLILFDLFLKNWERNEKEQLYIVLFVQNLEFLVQGTTKTALSQWLNDLPESIRPAPKQSEPEIYPERPSDEALKKLQAYFLITVEPLETSDSDKYRVNGYVVTRIGNEDRYTKIESISLLIPLPKEANKLFTDNPYYTLEQINQELPEWLIQAKEVIDNQCTEIQKSYHLELPPVSDLTVEFWLPFEHLSTAAETWKIYGQPTRLKRRTRTLGQEYRIVVRSYDRFSDPDSLNELNRTWQALLTASQDSVDDGSTFLNTPHFDCWSHWEELKRLSKQVYQGLSLICPLCSQQYKRQQEDLFAWMLEKGIPFVLWSRSVDLTDEQKKALKQKMTEMLTADTLNQLEQLFEKIKQSRTVDSEDRLALWCDEPKRLIELKQFRERGRLHA